MRTIDGKRLRTAATPHGRRKRWYPIMVALVIIVCAMLALLAVSRARSAPGARPLTAAETDRFAVARFHNYQMTGREVTLVVPLATGDITVRASVDLRAHLGYGVISGSGQSGAGPALIQWSLTSLVLHQSTAVPESVPPSPPATGWHGRQLQTSGSALDTALRIALNLSSDRPDNAQLLRQSDAKWLGRTTIGSASVDIIDGPSDPADAGGQSRMRYWIGQDGTLVRVQASLASAPRPVLIDFTNSPYVPFTPLHGLR